MRKILLILTLGIIINSCATLPSTKIPQTFSTNNENGMIIGSIAFNKEKPIFNGYFFYYVGEEIKKITARKGISIKPEQMSKMKFKPDFFDGNKAVYYFSIIEPEGEYTFSNFRIHENGGFVQSTGDIPINIEFKIKKGKVKYLGEIYVNYNNSLVELNNQRKRDLVKLKEKFPNLKIE